MSFCPKLRTVLLALNILVLLLPLGGIAVLRLYESELVRQTESELISQAALTASMFRAAYPKRQAPPAEMTGAAIPAPDTPTAPPSGSDGEELIPVHPRLDLAKSRLRDPAPPADIAQLPADPAALAAGRLLSPVLADARRTMLSGIRIVDGSGIVVASSSTEAGRSLAAREEVAKALAGETVSLLRVRNSDSSTPGLSSISRRARVRVFVALPVLVEGRVVGAVIASRTPLDTAKALYQIRGHLLKVVLGLLLLVLLMATLTAYYINRPVQALIRQADRLKNGAGGGEPLDNPGIQEVAQLSVAIADMASTLESRSDYITTFATNVSHEFKTPLTSIHGAVEILKDHFQEMSLAERETFLGIIGSETGRLERLVRRLLDLARADTVSAGDDSTDALAVLDFLASRFRSQGVVVTLDCGATRLPIRMGRETFESIVSNLLENARQHGGTGVRVAIGATVTAGGALELNIGDDGPGISAGNRERIFQRFFTTARETGGSGLGLAIVQALLRAHGGSISLEPAERGAHFTVRVPLC